MTLEKGIRWAAIISAASHPWERLADVSRREHGVGENGTWEEWKSDAKCKPWHTFGSFLCQRVHVSVFSPTVANAFFKPTTCGDVGGHVSWSRYCFNRSLSDVMVLRADFMVVCTEDGKKHSFNFKQRCGTISSYYSARNRILFCATFACIGAWK